MRAYHFLQEDMTSGAGNEAPWKIGEERIIDGSIELCQRGYHSSATWFDALQYAPGPMACIVEISEPEAKGEEKQVSRSRKLIACKDITRELRLFACDQAEQALALARVEDKRSWNAIEVARRYADGNATPDDLVAARDAAWDAAKGAAWDAAWDAAWVAAWVAAKEDCNRRIDALFVAEQVVS